MSKCTCIEQDGHEQDCPNRSLRPGDYVRWDNIGWGTFLWIEGILVSLEPNPAYPGSHNARIDIKRSCGFAVGTTQTVGVERGVTLRRCDERSTHRGGTSTAREDFLPIMGIAAGDHRVDAMRYAMSSLGTYDETFAKVQSDIVDRKFKVSLDASWMDRAFQGVPGPAKECEMCCIPGATAATGRCSHGHLYRSEVRDTAPAPAPVLHDGLTAEQCLELYVERQREHDGSADCYMMTEPQLAAARELWSAQLRAKRDAANEKERCEVTYCEVDADE